MDALDTMTATLPAHFVANGRNLAGEKEIINAYVLISENREAARAVCYMGKSRSASTVYASVWLRSSPTFEGCGGHGKASGYGYDKKSAAIGEALKSAGVTLSQAIGGRGEGGYPCRFRGRGAGNGLHQHEHHRNLRGTP